MLKIGRSVAREPIYNTTKTHCVFVERIMRYVFFGGDGFFLVCAHLVRKRCQIFS